MPRIVRGALVQASWTGDKESMIQKHEERAHQAAKDGAGVILFQELFYGPYFCQVQDAQYYSYTELIPDGPTTKRMQDLAKQTGMVIVAPMYEEDEKASGIYYNTAAVIDADGTYLGKYRKTHIPHVKGFWEKFYFRPGNLGYPVFQTAVGKIGVYICYDRHFPEGARALASTGPRSCSSPAPPRAACPSTCGASSSSCTRSPTATTSAPSTGSASSRTSATTTSTGRATSWTRVASSSAKLLRVRGGAGHPRPRPGQDHGGPEHLAVLPRPPSRRLCGPDAPIVRGRAIIRAGSVWRRTAEPLRFVRPVLGSRP